MMLSINAGPFALALTHLLLLIALVTATLIEARFARRVHAKKTAVFSLFILGVVAARIAFVLTYFTQYSDAPLKALDIRDGGFLVWPGIAAAILGGLLIGWRHPEQRRALAFSMTAGLAIWLLGGWLLSSYQQGAPLPQITLRTLHGEPVSVAEYRGKPVVINLWATWCPPCRREMPVLRDMQLEREDIVFVFVNQAESAQAVSDYLSRQQLVLSNSFLDPEGEFAREVGSAALPTTLFYSSDGRLTGSHMGEMSRASLTHYLDSQTGARSAVSGTSSHRD
ncbi:peroxiredoxin [Pseudomonas syringae pv. avii]|uniref:Peroxiredoxin n=3 Tax=Pseudomonas TaxID=286 RepID=A0ABY1U3Z2_PSESX|nr:peroxiredoxin [Pseudomonas syringae pv. persicae]SOQ07963.1 peroxiredoxin [Pseudomonas syringae pv. persicae]SOS26079.1 peroxiredoxin [Pseudomonas syringae pv. avii]